MFCQILPNYYINITNPGRSLVMNHKQLIIKILNLLGMNRLNSGYNYIVHGLNLLLEDDRLVLSIVKSLYIEIANTYNTSWKCVERNMRRVIKGVWISANDKLLKTIFQKTSADKTPTNKEFLIGLCDFILSADFIPTKEEIVITCPISQKYCKAFTDYCICELQANKLLK